MKSTPVDSKMVCIQRAFINTYSLIELNAFEGMLGNSFFIAILIATAVVQAIFVEFGSDFTSTSKLNWWKWFVCLGFGLLELPIGFLCRLIPIESILSETSWKQLEDMSA